MFSESLDIDTDIERLAQRGDAKALFEKGYRLEQQAKHKFEENHTDDALSLMRQAVDFYQRSANRGYAEAYYQLGRIYHKGRYGIASNVELALHYYESAADLNIPQAANNAAKIYLDKTKETGDQAKKNMLYAKAASWLSYLKDMQSDSADDLTLIQEAKSSFLKFSQLLTNRNTPIPTYQVIPAAPPTQLNPLPSQSLLDEFDEENRAAVTLGLMKNRMGKIEQSDKEVLKQLPILQGLTFQAVPGDGHCLFHAVGLYLGQDASYLRKIVAAHMEANREELIDFYSGTQEKFKQHIEAIRSSDEWADEMEIAVLERLLNRPVIILRSDSNPIIPDNLSELHGEPIFVYYNGHTHYDAFVLQDGFQARVILNNIVTAIEQGETVKYKVIEHTNISSFDINYLLDSTQSFTLKQRLVSQDTYQAALAKKERALDDEQEQLWRNKNTVQVKARQVAQETLETEQLLKSLTTRHLSAEDEAMNKERLELEKKKSQLDKLKSELLDEKTVLDKKQLRLHEERAAFEQQKQHAENQLILQQEKMEATFQIQRLELEEEANRLKDEALKLTNEKERYKDKYNAQLEELKLKQQQIKDEKKKLQEEQKQLKLKIGRPSTADEERRNLEQRLIEIESLKRRLQEKESRLEKEYLEKEKKLKQDFELKMSQLDAAQNVLNERQRELDAKDIDLQREKKFYQDIQGMMEEQAIIAADIEKKHEALSNSERKLELMEQRIMQSKELFNKWIKSHHSPLLILFVQKGSITELNELIKCGLDLNVQDAQGRTALHWAIKSHNVSILKLLLLNKDSYQINPNIQDREEKTALHYAIEALGSIDRLDDLKSKMDCLSLLLEYKSSPAISLIIKDTNDKHPLELLSHGLFSLRCDLCLAMDDSEVNYNQLSFYIEEVKKKKTKVFYHTKNLKGEFVKGEITEKTIGKVGFEGLITAIKQKQLHNVSEANKKIILRETTYRGHTLALCQQLINEKNPKKQRMDEAFEIIYLTINIIQGLKNRTDQAVIQEKSHEHHMMLHLNPNSTLWPKIKDSDIKFFWENLTKGPSNTHGLLENISQDKYSNYHEAKHHIELISRSGVLNDANSEQWVNYIKLFNNMARRYPQMLEEIFSKLEIRFIEGMLLKHIRDLTDIPLEARFHTYLVVGDLYFEKGKIEEALAYYTNARGYAYHITKQSAILEATFKETLQQLSYRFLALEAVLFYQFFQPLLKKCKPRIHGENVSKDITAFEKLWGFWNKLIELAVPLQATHQQDILKYLLMPYQTEISQIVNFLLLNLKNNIAIPEKYKEYFFKYTKPFINKCKEFGLDDTALRLTNQLTEYTTNPQTGLQRPGLTECHEVLVREIAPLVMNKLSFVKPTLDSDNHLSFIYRNQIIQLRNQLFNSLKMEPPENQFKIQQNFTDAILEIFKQMLNTLVNKLAHFIELPPCSFCFCIVGSGQRGTLSPASDIDCHILIQHDAFRDHAFFKKLIAIFQLQIALIESGDYSGKNDIIFSGFYVDPGDFIPSEGKISLLNTPSGLWKHVKDIKKYKDLSEIAGNQLPPELSAQIESKLLFTYDYGLIGAAKKLWDDYRGLVEKEMLGKISNNQSVFSKFAMCYIKDNYETYAKQRLLSGKSNQFDIKTDFLNPLSYLTLFLAMAYGCKTQNLGESLLFLKNNSIMEQAIHECLFLALATIYRFRCISHLVANTGVDSFLVIELSDLNTLRPFKYHLIGVADYQILCDIDNLITKPLFEYCNQLAENHIKKDMPLLTPLQPDLNKEAIAQLTIRLKEHQFDFSSFELYQAGEEKNLFDERKSHDRASNPINPLTISDDDSVPELPEESSDRDSIEIYANFTGSMENQMSKIELSDKRAVEQMPILQGLAFQPMPKDGSCLFHAVGIYLGDELGKMLEEREKVQRLRQKVAEYMEEKREELIDFYPEGKEKFNQHIEAIRSSNEWADELEIVVLGRLLNRPIIILRSDSNPTILGNLSELHGEPIFVYYNGCTHYDAFILQEGFQARVILNNIITAIEQGKIVIYNAVEHTKKFPSGVNYPLDSIQSLKSSILLGLPEINESKTTKASTLSNSETAQFQTEQTRYNQHSKFDAARLMYNKAKTELDFENYKEAYIHFRNARTFFKDAKQELGEDERIANKLKKVESYLEQCKQLERK